MGRYIRWLEDLTNDDVELVGGKNASLGEMTRELKSEGVRVPEGFATVADAYRDFCAHNSLPERMEEVLEEYRRGERTLARLGSRLRSMIGGGEMPDDMAGQIGQAYGELAERLGVEDPSVAVRSSATAEDLPDASFAGQQETFLNVSGSEALLEAVKDCFVSLFTDRAIAYREEKGFDHMRVALSAGVQSMVRSDKAGSGVMFSLDTESGFPRVVLINAAWGLGETVVQGSVAPDEYRVFKPLLAGNGYKPIVEKRLGAKERKMVYASGATRTTKITETSTRERRSFVLNDEEILELARYAVRLEEHYGRPMDMEWAKDGVDGKLYIVQARPETVQSRRDFSALKNYTLTDEGTVLVRGVSVGDAIGRGRAQVIAHASDIDEFEDGSVLVTGMTDPDWVPIMKRAAAIVTDSGGRTCHAAIVSRELDIPAVVGTGDATHQLEHGQEVTVSCAGGEDGVVYEGLLDYEVEDQDLSDLPEARTDIMLNVASPQAAFRWWRLPVKGIGLARMEFLINNVVQVHPMALIRYDELESGEDRRRIDTLTRGYDDRTEYFVDHLSRGMAKIAAAVHPDPAVVRMSDFKTNEYADLLGGRQFETEEGNPMIGFRGAARYQSERYREGFALECRALKRAREEMGFTNISMMIPFCRTIEEADGVLEEMARNGLVRGENGLEVMVMCEVPSNVILARQFAERFDGFSIGSNDLTQLVLGVDRDSGELAHLFDERDEAVTRFITQLMEAVKPDSYVGICGQGPSDHPDFARFLVRAGVDSMSLNPDSVVRTIRIVAELERELGKGTG